MSHPIHRLAELGQSIWYDFIKRDLVTGGGLARLVGEEGLRGMTSNPTIFEKAIAGSNLYDAAIRERAPQAVDTEALVELLAIEDVRGACDVFRPLWVSSSGLDGYVSLEVSPKLARDAAATIAAAKRLAAAVDRPNLMIKIPGTAEGLPAVEEALYSGINVNVTLLFSVERHGEVINAYLRALERRVEAGLPVDRIASVASFFVSRVDSACDKRLKANGSPEALRLVSKLAIDNARLAYELFESRFHGPRWEKLLMEGARVQRPLWASTSTKDPGLPDVYYVESLVAPHSVNTLPPETFQAYCDHGKPAERIHEDLAGAKERVAAFDRLGLDLAAVLRELEEEGVRKFAESWDLLLAAVEKKKAVLTK
jgi:transaldolase